jgi:predicted MPP superfamily phosphohydrolase
MVHLYINLLYYLPHLYLFFRIKNQFISRKYRILYTIIYIGIASIFPIVGFHPSIANPLMRILAPVSDYLLPFYLYVFLFMVAFDLLLLLNFLIRIIPHKYFYSLKFRFYTLTLMVALSIGIVYAGAVNLNTIQVSQYKIEVPRKNSSLDHLKVAFIADAHIQENFPMDFLDQFIRKVNDLHSDVLLCGGDIVEGGHLDGRMEVIETKLRSIKTRYGVYAVFGNHEGYGRNAPIDFFKNAGMILLRDSVLRIDSAFYIGGRNDKRSGTRKSVSELMGEKTPDLPFLLMDHRPLELKEVSRTPVDVQFSGHTHNGQLFPLNFIIHTLYELSWGYKKIGNTHFFVTSGLRLWGPPVKTAGKAEIMLVDIVFN